jgi:hypothetical protein
LREHTGSIFREFFYPEEGGNTFSETVVTIYQSRGRRVPEYSCLRYYSYFLRGRRSVKPTSHLSTVYKKINGPNNIDGGEK